MKMIEITFRAEQRELEKLNAQFDRAKQTYDKKLAIAQKLGVDTWDNDTHYAWLQTAPTSENGWLLNKADIKMNGAWFDLVCARDRIEEIQNAIARAEKRLEKSEAEVRAYYAELEQIADLQAKEKLMKLQFEQEQKEWAKDGITLENRYYGKTPQGKCFEIWGNNGITNRSLHCFSLRIDGETIFTSGEFWRAYAVIKKS